MKNNDILQATIQNHVHEFAGFTELAGDNEQRHNHCFTGVTSQVIPMGDHHIHGLYMNIDLFNHHHEVIAITGLPIDVWGRGKTHAHFVKTVTSMDNGHYHKLQFASLLPSPLH